MPPLETENRTRTSWIEDDAEDQQDCALVDEVRNGSSEALEALIRRHQRFLYNLAVRMLYRPQDAEDATQEILIKLVTKLSTFEGRSRFRTWLYRIAMNHLLNMKRGSMEPETLTFTDYGSCLEGTLDQELPDPRETPVDVKLLIDEARIGCTMAMLLCLDREQRLIYVLGEILGITDAVGAELLDISKAAFRQKLSRTRQDLHGFLKGQCGLIDKTNPCRCDKKTRGFMKSGYVNPENLLFARERVQHLREVAGKHSEEVHAYDGLCSDLYREHPYLEVADIATRIREVMTHPDFQKTFHV